MTKDEYKKFIEMAKEIRNMCYDRITCADCPFSKKDNSSDCIFDGYPHEWSTSKAKEWKKVKEES